MLSIIHISLRHQSYYRGETWAMACRCPCHRPVALHALDTIFYELLLNVLKRIYVVARSSSSTIFFISLVWLTTLIITFFVVNRPHCYTVIFSYHSNYHLPKGYFIIVSVILINQKVMLKKSIWWNKNSHTNNIYICLNKDWFP